MRGTLYGVGVGPGDPKLLTLLAVETLQQVDQIVVPDMGGEKTAFKIAAEYIKDKEKLFCHMPMTKDAEVLAKGYQQTADLICEQLELGKNIAFITLGDPTVYSTYIYVHRLVLARGYTAQIINGIPSFCAVAARLGDSLCDRDQALHIIPASYEHTQRLLELDGTKVLMKSASQMPEVLQALENTKQLTGAKMVECCSMPEEKVHTDLTKVESGSYFSVIVVKEEDK